SIRTRMGFDSALPINAISRSSAVERTSSAMVSPPRGLIEHRRSALYHGRRGGVKPKAGRTGLEDVSGRMAKGYGTPERRVGEEMIAVIVDALIELPEGSQIKYEIDEERGVLRVDRILPSPVVYPANYGYIPETLAE